MNDRIVPGNYSVKKVGIANITNDKLYPVLRKPSNAVRISSIGQLIQDGDTHIRNVARDIADKRRAAKTTTTCNQNIVVLLLHAHRPSFSYDFVPFSHNLPEDSEATLTVAFSNAQLKPLLRQLGIILSNRLEKVFEC